MNVNEVFLEVLAKEGVVSLVTWAQGEPKIDNTWNSYTRMLDEETILLPVGGMHTTEQNIKFNDQVKITLGSKEVQGLMGMGTGFLIHGTATFTTEGDLVQEMLTEYPWARSILAVKIDMLKQTV